MAIRIRTITLGIGDRHPLPAAAIGTARRILDDAQRRCLDLGFEVQTLRISTRSVFEHLPAATSAQLRVYCADLQQRLADTGIAYCSLGRFIADSPRADLERALIIPDLLAANPALYISMQVGSVARGINTRATLIAAQVILTLATSSEGGMGNFNFAATANCPPDIPFFPAAYHASDSWALGIGLQSAGFVRDVLADLARHEQAGVMLLPHITTRLRAALEQALQPIAAVGADLADDYGLQFTGIDLSPAPMGEESIVAAIEACGLGRFGEAGTLAVAASLTAALRSTILPTGGYCGLMLPVLEDALLGRRCQEYGLRPQMLLAYSAICGTGLDTVPLPGDTPPERLAALLSDVAALAVRLDKPLSARLFPIPGRMAGEMTTFQSPYLTNTAILPC
jgi:uncharacterized protein (UPF0210 family)